MNRIDDLRLAYHYKVIRDVYGLLVSIPNTMKREQLIDLMRLDKKAIDGLTFVLDSKNGIEIVSGISEKYLNESFDAMQLL
jgi:5-deoxy-5-amino-3-dehydroquinate synthase